jgi:hypothetical protein
MNNIILNLWKQNEYIGNVFCELRWLKSLIISIYIAVTLRNIGCDFFD